MLLRAGAGQLGQAGIELRADAGNWSGGVDQAAARPLRELRGDGGSTAHVRDQCASGVVHDPFHAALCRPLVDAHGDTRARHAITIRPGEHDPTTKADDRIARRRGFVAHDTGGLVGDGIDARRVRPLHRRAVDSGVHFAGGAAFCILYFPAILRGTSQGHTSVHGINSPLSTISAGGTHHGLVTPTLIQAGYGERAGQQPRVLDIGKPLGTIVAGGGKHALVAAFLAKHYTGVVGADLRDPMPTVTSVDHNALVAATLIQTGHGEGACGTKRFSHGTADLARPHNTITASGGNGALVAALLIKYYGNDREGVSLTDPLHTIPTKDRFGLVTVTIQGTAYYISDIGMRMLAPHELYAAQGFPIDYQIDRGADGRPMTKTAQVRMVGNSVCPPVARAVVLANYATAVALQEQAA